MAVRRRDGARDQERSADSGLGEGFAQVRDTVTSYFSEEARGDSSSQRDTVTGYFSQEARGDSSSTEREQALAASSSARRLSLTEEGEDRASPERRASKGASKEHREKHREFDCFRISSQVIELSLSLLLALLLTVAIPGTGRFSRVANNGFAWLAASAPGAHWGNWRSLTRCDCKAYSHCLADLPVNGTSSRALKLMTCKLETGPEEQCQLTAQDRAEFDQFRLFLPELALRMRLAADLPLYLSLPCHWLMVTCLLEILLFIASATTVRWGHELKAKKSVPWIIGTEAVIFLLLYFRHEALSYFVHWLYKDDYSTCDTLGLVFRDIMLLWQLALIILRVVRKGPYEYPSAVAEAEKKFSRLNGRPLWAVILMDPRHGALHRYSGFDLQLAQDPLSFIIPAYKYSVRFYHYLQRAVSRSGAEGKRDKKEE